jgi:hypothetical protein
MVTTVETLRRELMALMEQRKSYRVLHQRVPKDLERRIAEIESQLTPNPAALIRARRASLIQRPTFPRVLWEQRYVIGALTFLAATAIVFVYY